MIRDAIKEITGILDQRFLMYVYLPVIAFCLGLLAVWIGTRDGFSHALQVWRRHGTFEQVLTISGFLLICFVLATIIANLLTPLTRLFEGYWSFADRLVQAGRGWHQRVLLTREFDETYDTYPPPGAIHEVMPTRIGNVIKNAELYPASRYGINSLVIWPRLYDLFPASFLEVLAGARAELEFLLLIATLSAAFSVITGVYLLLAGTSWWLFLLFFWGGFALASLSYRSAVSSAELYGVQIKVGFDLYRKRLLEQLDFPTPGNLGAEKTVWEKVSAFLDQNVDPSQSYPESPSDSTPETITEPTLDSLPKLSLGWKAMLAVFVVGLFGALLIGFMGRASGTPSERLVIIQLNDTYRIDAVENGNGGGFSRVATLVRQAKSENQNVLIFHAGDFVAPSLESTYFQGQQMIDALNYLHALAPVHVVPGNHEFDSADPAMLANAIRRSNFSWVCSNLRLNTNNSAADTRILPREVLTVGDLRVGVFGLTIHGLQNSGDQPYAAIAAQERYVVSEADLALVAAEAGKNEITALRLLQGQEFNSKTEFQAALQRASGSTEAADALFNSFADYFFDGYSALAEQEITRLENEGASVIIGLTHLNMSDDRKVARLRQRHPAFVWIAGGHEHYAQREGLSSESALITKADSNARTAWKINVGLTNGTPDIIAEKITISKDTLALDENYQRDIVETWSQKLKERMGYIDQELGTVSQINLNDRCFEATEEIVRNSRSDWGSFLAERMRNAYTSPTAQIGVITGGTIRIDDNFCDTVRYEQMERSIGFETRVVYVELSGRDFQNEILERAVGTKRGDGRFLQTAGVTYDFDRRRKPGDRVFNVKVQKGDGWAPLDLNLPYVVAVNDYIFKCNDGYRFRDFVTRYIEAGPDVRALVVDAFNRANSARKIVAGPFEAPAYLKETWPNSREFTGREKLSKCQ